MSAQLSLVVIGTRGSGLSSFALIAARLTGFHIIDVDALFVGEHGMSRRACLREWGEQRYCDTSARHFRDLLSSHLHDHILLCASVFEAAGSNARSLVQASRYGTAVVMISRERGEVQRHLALADSPEVQRILFAKQQFCRQVSDVEYYNLSEDQGPQEASDAVFCALRSDQPFPRRTRRLQNVTRDVLCLLRMLNYRIGGEECLRGPDEIQSREFPSYTTLNFTDVLRKRSDMVGLDCASDVLELLVPLPTIQATGHEDIESICESFQLLRRHFQLPIIYHIEWDPNFSPSEKTRYSELSKQGLRLLPEYATIDLRCSDHEMATFVSACRGRTKVLGHRTYSTSEDFSWRDPSLLKQCRRAAALGCNYVRFLRFAVTPSEDRECTAFQAVASTLSSIPVSASSVDRFARSSAVNNPGLTAVSQPSFSTLNELESLANSHDLTRARFSGFVFHPLHFHIYGASVDYSLSPAMHNVAFECLGMGHRYSPHQSNSLQEIKNLFNDTFGGASISLPFKSAVIDLLDTISEPAKIIQAVNTVLPRRAKATQMEGHSVTTIPHNEKNRAGKIVGLHGENTDWVALRDCILRQLSAANSVDPLTTALVVGAGGMARASVYALMKLGVKHIVIWNRTMSRAELLVANFTKYATGLASSASNRQTRFRIIESFTNPWPSDMKQPSIIVCTPPAHSINSEPGLDFTIPEPWFRSKTGGVIVEVSLSIPQASDYSLIICASCPTKRGLRPFCVKHTTMRIRDGLLSSPLSYSSNKAALSSSYSPAGTHRGTK